MRREFADYWAAGVWNCCTQAEMQDVRSNQQQPLLGGLVLH
jgi:hypothetical protein